jgi:type IV pilus assembly protein PilC
VAVFAYRGHTASGAVSGRLEAPDRPAAASALRARGIVATRLQECPAQMPGRWRPVRVRDRELALYTRQLSTMISAGLPIAQCLAILAEQGENPRLCRLTAAVAADVAGGATLADAFRKHPRVFGDLFTNMLQVGETAGALDTILGRLSVYLEKAAALRRKVKGAMIYPLTIMGVAALVVVFMMAFVIPTFAQMFANFGAELPWPTRIVIGLSELVRALLVPLTMTGAATAYGIRRAYRTDRGRFIIDRLLLKIPVLAPIIRKVAIARVTRTLGTLIACGVPILESLRITARTAGNQIVQDTVMMARTAIAGGRNLTEPLRDYPVPAMVVQMVNVGEQTGSMDVMLTRIADFYDDEVEAAVSGLTALLEPAMVVFLGVVIGGLVIAMYLPIFRLVAIVR